MEVPKMTAEIFELTYLDFKILNENWNSYRLEDKTILKARVFLVSYARVEHPAPNQPTFIFALHTAYGVESPPEIRSQPDSQTYTTTELMKELEPGKEDLKFEPVREVWNEYVIEDSTRISLKVTPTRIMRTTKFDLAGNPQYVVQSVVLPKAVAKDPKKLATMASFGTTGN